MHSRDSGHLAHCAESPWLRQRFRDFWMHPRSRASCLPFFRAFSSGKEMTRGGGTAPPGPSQAEKTALYSEAPSRMVCSMKGFKRKMLYWGLSRPFSPVRPAPSLWCDLFRAIYVLDALQDGGRQPRVCQLVFFVISPKSVCQIVVLHGRMSLDVRKAAVVVC